MLEIFEIVEIPLSASELLKKYSTEKKSGNCSPKISSVNSISKSIFDTSPASIQKYVLIGLFKTGRGSIIKSINDPIPIQELSISESILTQMA